MTTTKDAYIPQFSGNPDDLKAFVDQILSDMTVDQLINYALPNSEAVTTPSGYQLPVGVASAFLDAISGVDTDLPLAIHVAQSWNKNLAKNVGWVIGTERRGQIASDNPNTAVYAGLGDIRCNPLAGRLFEGFGEDPYMVSEFVSLYGAGAIGDDGFYTKAQINTKHFSTYHTEWNRFFGNYYISSRGLYEYQFPSFFKTFKENHHVGLMTSFGCLNGVQNVCSPYIKDMQDYTDFHLFNFADYNGDYVLLLGISNGYDETYAKTPEQVAAMCILSGLTSNVQDAGLITADDYRNAVEKNLLGVTLDDLREHIRPQVELWVRGGYFNQDAYPYRDLCADKSPVTHNSAESQTVALQAAEEGFVLLKNNNNVLPLNKDVKILATGIFSELRDTPWYTIASPKGLDNAGLTPIAALEAYLEEQSGTVTYVPEASGDCLRFKSVSTGKYLTIEDKRLYASTTDAEDAAVFQMYDWGQKGYSFLDLATDSYIGGSKDADNDEIYMEEQNHFGDQFSNMPVLTYEDNGEGKKFLRIGTILTELVERSGAAADYTYYVEYTKLGRYLTVGEDNQVVKGNTVTQGYSDDALFEVETVSGAGEDVSMYVSENDYAILFIGYSGFVGAGEFSDRCDLDLGENQLALVNRVSQQFPGKTIVVLRSDVPIACRELQDNDDVAAILYCSYAGQYDNYALMKMLFGETTPSGKLVNTWLKDMSSLPAFPRDVYADPQYVVEMRNADPIEQKLSYLYNNPADALYEFGYGLSYTTFTYSDINYDIGQNVDGKITASVKVTNTGNYAGKEVVQLYAASVNSKYAGYVPSKQLIAFEKTELLASGESQIVRLTADLEYLRKWDVTARKYIFEKGSYTFSLGSSSEKLFSSASVFLDGGEVGTITLNEAVNIWESCYGMVGPQGIEVSKKRSLAYDGKRNFFAIRSVNEGDYVVLPNVDLTGVRKLAFSVATTNDADSTIEVYIGGVDNQKISSVTFDKTEPVRYYLDSDETILVEELGYKTVEGEVLETAGIHDLYIVFKQSGIRLEFIQAALD